MNFGIIERDLIYVKGIILNGQVRIMKNCSNIRICAEWLVDGSGAPALKDQAIDISEGRIVSVDNRDSAGPADCNIIDCSGCTIIPGLIDCHAHLAVTGNLNESQREGQLESPFDVIEKRIEGHLRDHFSHGVLAVRDGGDRSGYALRYKKECHSMNPPVHISASGRAWHGRGRYGAFLGSSPETGMEPAGFIMNNLEKGADHLKVINSGIISLSDCEKEIAPHFTATDLKKIVKAARSAGLKVMVHANGPKPVRSAIEAECDSIEHGFFMGDDNLKRMADKNIVWVPTVYAMEALRKSSRTGTGEYEIASRVVDNQISQFEKAVRCGVPLAIGTDSGSPGVNHGSSMIDEIKLFMSAGLSIEKLIGAGLRNGSSLFKKGSGPPFIMKGSPATFLVVEGNPNKLPESLSQIKAIWVEGETWHMVQGKIF